MYILKIAFQVTEIKYTKIKNKMQFEYKEWNVFIHIFLAVIFPLCDLFYFYSFEGETGTKCRQAFESYPHTEHTKRDDGSWDHTARSALRPGHQRTRSQRQKSGKDAELFWDTEKPRAMSVP